MVGLISVLGLALVGSKDETTRAMGLTLFGVGLTRLIVAVEARNPQQT